MGMKQRQRSGIMARDIFAQRAAKRQQNALTAPQSMAPRSRQTRIMEDLASGMLLGRRKRGGPAGLSFFDFFFGQGGFSPDGGFPGDDWPGGGGSFSIPGRGGGILDPGDEFTLDEDVPT